MPYFKKRKKKINGKWYPQSVTVGEPVTTDEVAQLLADLSAVSPGDTFSVLKNLARAMSIYMSSGRTVKLDGVGTFYYSAKANGQGVDTPEEVNANQIVGVRVRFIPEMDRNSQGAVSRALVPNNLKWEELFDDPSKGTTTTPGTGAAKAPSADHSRMNKERRICQSPPRGAYPPLFSFQPPAACHLPYDAGTNGASSK